MNAIGIEGQEEKLTRERQCNTWIRKVSYVNNKTRIHSSVTNYGKVRSGSVELITLAF